MARTGNENVLTNPYPYMINLSELKGYLLGSASLTYYVAAEIFALLALVVSLYLHSQKRDVASPNTPVGFSWKFLLWDNFKRIAVGQIVMFFLFRFTVEILGKQLDMWVASGVGFILSFGIDKAIQFLVTKNPTALATGARDAFLKQNS
jgi:hypothetical protein